jgi:capping protein beta
MENKIRSTLYEIYFGKTRDIVNGVRSTQPLQNEKQKINLQNDLAQALQKRAQTS